MNELQFSTKEFTEKLKFFIFCPGLSKSDLSISFDKKNGILELSGKPAESEISKLANIEISGKLNVSPKYRSNKIKASVVNGIATIEFGLSDDVTVINAE